MIVDVNAIMLIKKKKTKSKLVVTTSREITIKEPFHQQLEMELLMQLEEGEHTKKS
jgi:hypothetical protein